MQNAKQYKPNKFIAPVGKHYSHLDEFDSCMDAPVVLPAGSVKARIGNDNGVDIGFPTGEQSITYRTWAYTSPKMFL
jgi:hypothetical protein